MKCRYLIHAALHALVLAFAVSSGAWASADFSPADDQGRAVYLITFEEPGLLEQHRLQRGSGSDFDFNAPATRVARDDLQAVQAGHVSDISSAVGRSVQPSHYYLVSHSGIAARLTPQEARTVRGLPGVARIERERVYQPDTYRGPEFIGAGSLWDGTGNPGGAGLLGEEMVSAILDTGIVVNHPSFANDPACGHGVGGAGDKLLSALDCSSTDGSGMCNGPNPADGHSHGSHVAGTVAGNTLDETASPPPPVEISGVAPCARIRAYKVCPSSCPGADIQAGMDSVLMHGDVDVMNFSISGGRNPWNDNDRRKLDLVDAGIFVAASAGNTSDSIPNPYGQVGHLGPWVATVANSSHDGLLAHALTVAGTLGPIAALPGTGPGLSADFNGQIRWAGDVDAANIEGCSAFAAGSFSGEAALISRGTCPFADKVNNAVAAGAAYVVVYNNEAGAPIVMGGLEATTVASAMVSMDDGGDIIAELGGASASVLVESALTAFSFPELGDILSGGSLVGPTPSPVQNLQKPDITGPGTSIFAPGTGSSGYTLMSGTSMSSPHLAGAAVLMHQAHPDWTPVEVKSAIMMTASKTGSKPAGAGPWDADDVGSGRADLSVAAQAGLVMHETFANFLAANPASGGDVRTLNIPAVRDMDCTPNCTFTRTVRNTLTTASSWTAGGDGITGDMNVSVSPSSFSFSGGPGETQELTITITPLEDLTGSIGFGEVVLSEDGDQSPELHMTVAISGEPGGPVGPAIETSPEFFDFVMNPDATGSQTLNIANTGIDPLDWTVDTEDTTAGIGSPREFDGDFAIANWTLVNTPAGVNGSFNTNAGPPIELFVVGGDDATGGTTDLEIVIPADGEIAFDWGYQSLDEGCFDTGGYVVNGDYTELACNQTSVPFFSESETVAVSAGDVFAFRVATDDGEFGEGTLGVTNFEFTPTGTAECDTLSNVTWLSLNPDQGTTAAGDNDDVSVDVDTTGMAEGEYTANLCINSNATNEPLVVVPVTVTVQSGTIDPPTIDAAPLSFSYNLISGETDGDDLTIGNLGDELLIWNIATAEGAAFAGLPRGGDIVVFDDVNYAVNSATEGSSFNWVSGDICDCDDDPGYHFNPWSSSGDLAFWWWGGTDQRAGVSMDGTTYAVLEEGDTIGPASTFISAGFPAATPNWRQAGNVDGYLGFRFTNPDTSAINYGYARLNTTGETGHPATVVGWAYNQVGDPITVSAGVPSACENPANIPWLSVDPVSGSTTGGNNSTVAVSVDSSGLEGGIYEALLCVSSNDPAAPLVEIPVTLDVTGAPEIDVDPTSISMSLEPDSTDSADVTITNLGEATLDWEVDESPSANSSVLRAGSATVPATVAAQPSAGLSTSTQTMSVKSASGLAVGPLGAGGIVLTHSASQTITPANAVACSPDGGTTTSINSFLRTFTLGDFGIAGAFDVSEVSFGIENLSVAADVDVNLYSLDGALTYANMTLIGSATESLASQGETIVNVPVTGTIPAGGTLVVEIVPPDLSGTGAFFPGSNSAGETAPSYIASTSCDINDPVTYDSIGFPQVQLVMNVTGDAGFDCTLPGWISNVSPLSGSLAQSASEPLTVTLDSTGLSADTYSANVCLSSNDPVTPVTVIPVELQVGLGPDDAQLSGTVTGLGYCSEDPTLLEGASVEVVGSSSAVFNTTTDANGEWELILDAGESPVDITVSAAGHLDGVESGVALTAQETTVVDFDLVLDQACATATPDSIAVGLSPDSVAVEAFEIGNVDGGTDLTWDIFTAEVASNPRAHFPAMPYMAAPVSDPSASMLADESVVQSGSGNAGILGGAAVPAYSTTGFAAQGYISMDALVPGTVNIINADQPTNVYAAAFIDNDFTQHYMLASAGGDLPGETFGTTDTATGVFTSLGVISGAPAGNTWTSMKWDHSTQTLFAVNSAGGGQSSLYTIDPDTLEATLVGQIDGPGVDPGAIVIAIAISPDGLMYGLDIIGDTLLAIDKSSGDASPIGPTGFDANFAQDMDFDPSTGVLYWPGYFGGGATEMTTIDTSTGAATSIGVITSQNEMLSFTVAVEGEGASCTEPASVPWLSIDPISGSVPAGDSEMVEVTLDSTGLSNGVYEAWICVDTSDPDNELIAVPVLLEVVEDALFQDRFEQ